jgi:phosphatidylglycerophosphate synthase
MPFSPDVDPKYISLLSIVVSLLVLFFRQLPYLALIVFAVLYLDALDGHIARKYRRASREGHLTDIASDRMSELLMFSFNPLLLMAVYANILLSISNLKKGTWILPLRHVYLLYLLYLVLAGASP